MTQIKRKAVVSPKSLYSDRHSGLDPESSSPIGGGDKLSVLDSRSPIGVGDRFRGNDGFGNHVKKR